jgi:hypothetical protein
MKIGKATVPRSAICTSNEDTIVVRGHDLARDLIGQVNFGDYFFLLLTGKQARRGGQRGAQCHAGGDRRTRPGAQRAGGAHDAGGRARCDAGRGGGGPARLRLGDPRRVGDGGPPVRRDRRGGAGATAATCAPRPRPSWRTGARRSCPSPATATRSTSGATRASMRCSTCRRGRRRPAVRRDRQGGRGGHPRGGRQGPQAERVGRHSRPCCWASASRSPRCAACPCWRAPPA